jgi:flagellin-like protein
MKGISPIVASVLLIAITMTLAGGLALWATKLVGKQLPEPESEVQCSLASFDFLSCNYNASTGNLIFTLSNRGSVELKNLTAFINFPNGSSYLGSSLNATLNTGANAVKSFTISGISPDFSSVLIKTNCPNVEVSEKCARS